MSCPRAASAAAIAALPLRASSRLRQARSQARRPNRRGRGRRGAKREQTPEPPEAEPPSLEDTHDLPDIADPLLRATVSAAFASLIDGRAKGPPMQGDRGVFSVGPAPGKDINNMNIIIVHLPEKGQVKHTESENDKTPGERGKGKGKNKGMGHARGEGKVPQGQVL